jgi:predicted Zn-dependent peptidase
MLNVGKSFLLYNRVDSLEEIYQKVESITSEQLIEVANEILNKEKLTTLMYK